IHELDVGRNHGGALNVICAKQTIGVGCVVGKQITVALVADTTEAPANMAQSFHIAFLVEAGEALVAGQKLLTWRPV
ncbi:MAG: hypothetical protein NUV56_02070, partial [Candidatus Uhrbacteria bacterium]|nr:hypothetical protein [Candidatus Uhrbacteria bacterium]